jgi:hypothetical protein
MASVAEYVRFADEAFGALHQMLAGVTEAEREATWDEITRELSQFAGPEGFVGPCEVIIGVGTKE